MDVSSLYTNIPQEEGTDIVCKAYERFHNHNPPIPTHYLREMLGLILKENSFQFNGLENYLQTHGTAMGTKKKTHFIIFKSNRKKLKKKVSIKINAQPIEQLKYTKFLGLLFDEELSWKYHIDEVTNKISKMSGVLTKARHYLSLKTLQTLYNTMVYPYLSYCNIIWTSTYSTSLKSLFIIQKKNSSDYYFFKIQI